ncbi:hypothetical protein D3C71_1685850 [compost metagenome]
MVIYQLPLLLTEHLLKGRIGIAVPPFGLKLKIINNILRILHQPEQPFLVLIGRDHRLQPAASGSAVTETGKGQHRPRQYSRYKLDHCDPSPMPIRRLLILMYQFYHDYRTSDIGLSKKYANESAFFTRLLSYGYG